jgi:hypothetical protein
MFKNFLVVLALLVLAGGAGWWYWTTTPTYAAYEIVDSVKTHDLAKFQKYVDVDSVSDGIIDDLLAGPQNQAKQAGILPQILATSITAFIKPGLVAVTKEQIIKLVSDKPSDSSSNAVDIQTTTTTTQTTSNNGQFDESRQKLAALLPKVFPDTANSGTPTINPSSSSRPTQTTQTTTTITTETTGPRRKFRFVGISPVRKNGEFAEVSVFLRSNDDVPQELVIDLRIQDINNHWQLKRILNSPQMFNALAKTSAGQAIIRRLISNT